MPQLPGHYLWHCLDLHHLAVGYVSISRDGEHHLEYLRKKTDKQDFFIYQNDAGEYLTMYFDVKNVPPRDDNNIFVDAFKNFDLNWLLDSYYEKH